MCFYWKFLTHPVGIFYTILPQKLRASGTIVQRQGPRAWMIRPFLLLFGLQPYLAKKWGETWHTPFFGFQLYLAGQNSENTRSAKGLHSVNPVRQLLNYRRCCQPLRYAFNDNFSLPRCKELCHPFGVVKSPRLTNSLI